MKTMCVVFFVIRHFHIDRIAPCRLPNPPTLCWIAFVTYMLGYPVLVNSNKWSIISAAF